MIDLEIKSPKYGRRESGFNNQINARLSIRVMIIKKKTTLGMNNCFFFFFS